MRCRGWSCSSQRRLATTHERCQWVTFLATKAMQAIEGRAMTAAVVVLRRERVRPMLTEELPRSGDALTDYHGADHKPLSLSDFTSRICQSAKEQSRSTPRSSSIISLFAGEFIELAGRSNMAFVARVGQLRRTSCQFPRTFLLSQQTAFVRPVATANLVPQRAWISSSSLKSASAVQSQPESGSALSASGKARTEVPLPSQEKKEGAMQYAL